MALDRDVEAAREKYSGAWVSFSHSGTVKIGAVWYVREEKGYPREIELVTDNGIVRLADILEARLKP